MTFEEIKKVLVEAGGIHHYFMYPFDYVEEIKELNLGAVDIVEKVGGYEGAGEDMSRVIHFVDHDIYIKIIGYWDSYGGEEWYYSWTQVFPKEVLTTIYVEKDKEKGNELPF